MKDWYVVRLCLVVMFSFFLVTPSFAVVDEAILKPNNAESVVRTQFEILFASVTEQLANRQQMYIDNPVAYYDFLIATVVASWDLSLIHI